MLSVSGAGPLGVINRACVALMEPQSCWKFQLSAVYLHLLSRPDCLGVYDDSHFSVLCRARYVQQLKVLEAVCIRIHKPVLCKQKEHVVALKLYS